MKIVFSGGGTLGPVTPLLGIAEAVRASDPAAQFFWIGTKKGPEKKLVEESGIPFTAISSGKLRRYFSFYNIVDVAKIFAGFLQTFFILKKIKPNAVVSAGGFVSVPVHYAASLLGIPSWVHQQDVIPGLANRLIFPLAKIITTVFPSNAEALKKYQAVAIGNPARNLHTSPGTVSEWREKFGITTNNPVVLVVGGGTGAAPLNTLVTKTVPLLPTTIEVIHLLGTDRPKEAAQKIALDYHNYHPVSFVSSGMAAAYALTSVVVARAGMGTLTELASLKKTAIVFPKSDTPQIANAQLLVENGGVVMLDENTCEPSELAQHILELISNPEQSAKLGQSLHDTLPVASSSDIINAIKKL